MLNEYIVYIYKTNLVGDPTMIIAYQIPNHQSPQYASKKYRFFETNTDLNSWSWDHINHKS